MANVPSMTWFWAKLGNETWPSRYHPVICHLIDVGQVAHALWQNALRGPVRRWVTERLGMNCEEHAGRWIAFWVGAHDIGKVTPCFQYQQNSQTEALKVHLEASGYTFGSGNKRHDQTGTKALFDELTSGAGERWTKCDRGLANKIAVAVGGHHGTFPLSWADIGDEMGDNQWASARREMIGELARVFSVGALPIPTPPAGDQSVWMFLAGLTAVADWIGSNVDFFDPFGNAERVGLSFDVDGYCTQARIKAADALDRLGWLGRASSTGQVASFEEATGIKKPRDLQREIIQMASAMTTPQLVIVEAPMGEGKTEAAWYVADCWDRCGGAGTYVALPTMATSNQMSERVERFLGPDMPGKKNMMLLHGKAALNKQFEKLKYAARVYDDEKHPSAVVAEEWFAANKKHGLLAPYGVGTIDQALLAVLQTKHVFVRLFGLAGKCVILDEVHAYDAYMTTLMERLLRWLAALGCPVVLLSATLPKDKRLALLRAYTSVEIEDENEEIPYPRVTTVAVGVNTASVVHVPADETRKKDIHLGWVKEGGLVYELKTALKDGGCAAVIRNTVGQAQETYRSLRDGLMDAGIKVELFHARFPFGRRQEIETAVLARFGKNGAPANRNKRVLVATQVIEQSLDLDFDVMVSDVAPVDLVLQRAGRLHRHAWGVRPAGVETPRLWLVEPGEKDGRPDFGPSEYVYARYVLLRSLIALGLPRTTVALPDELERLVEQVYGTRSLEIPLSNQDDLSKSKQEMEQEQRKQNRTAKGVMIYRPDAEDLLEQPNMQLQEDDPDAHRKIQAATRDTEPTVQLILIYHSNGRDFLDAEGTEPFDEHEMPDIARLRRLLDNEVTISHPGCVFHYATRDKPVPPGWRKNGMLKHHRIVRLDPAGRSVSGEFPMEYDQNQGVRMI
ncbi:MAG: CRISPR-associated helicase Cas3 [Gemmataceae bacterium]|nr:CRISPR-associated helicase Cas3 [Gemmataceae bacterium]